MSILRKIFLTGNSKVVSIPNYLLDELHLSVGKQVYLERLYDKKQLVGFKIQPVIMPEHKE